MSQVTSRGPATLPESGLERDAGGGAATGAPGHPRREGSATDPVASLRRIGELGGPSGRSGRGSRRGGGTARGIGLPRLGVPRIGWLVVALVVVGLSWLGLRLFSAGPSIEGLKSGEILSPNTLIQRDIRVSAKGSADSVTVKLNGQELPGVVRDGSTLSFRLPALVDGEYQLAVTSDRRPLGRTTTTRHFVVDGTPPAIKFPSLADPAPIDRPLTLTGSIDGAEEIAVPGAEVAVDGSAVTLSFEFPPAAPVEIAATDEAGNKAVMSFVVPVRYPKTNGVHVTAKAWADPVLKAAVLQMIADKRINTVELDLKDEEGVVGYDSTVPLAKEIGATQPSYQLQAALDELHGLGVRVIGRIVAFRDPILARAAWAAGNTDWVLQSPDGQPFAAYGGFTNYVRPEVRAYNLAIAEEAARAGVDDVLWDYIRRPEGEPTTMVVPGLTGLSSEVIGQFLAEGHTLLRRHGVYQGASVFGISATRPQTIGQDVPLIAKHADYVAPMLYPERWGRTEYDVADPQAQPYDIVFRSLVDFQIAVAPMGRAVMPWLQDYDGRVPYGPPEVQAQMQAAADRGVVSWLFWNPRSQYSTEGYLPLP